MARLSGGLFGSLYDPERNRRTTSVFNQQPTGVGGQAASFAAAQESERARQAQQLAAAQAAAQQQQQQVASEAAAAQQRQEQARATAQQEQEFKLRQAQFENDKAIQAQQLVESKRAANATEAARQNQQRLSRGTANQQQYQRAVGGSNMAKSMQNHNARLKGQISPFPELNTAWSNSMEQYFAQPFGTKDPRQSSAGTVRDPRYLERSNSYYSNIRANRASGMSSRESVRAATRSAAARNNNRLGSSNQQSAFGSGAANAFQR